MSDDESDIPKDMRDKYFKWETHSVRHPLIVTYKATKDENFPLILLIGREPNNKTKMGADVGYYNFDYNKNTRRCAFWNMAYKLVGKQERLSVADFKNKCRRKRSSVICFTDSLPITIKSHVKSKKKLRQQISYEQKKTHVHRIFSNQIMKRVKIVFLSGLQLEEFSDCVKLIHTACYKLKIPIQEIQFLFPTNYKKISLNNSSISSINYVLKKWNDS